MNQAVNPTSTTTASNTFASRASYKPDKTHTNDHTLSNSHPTNTNTTSNANPNPSPPSPETPPSSK